MASGSTTAAASANSVVKFASRKTKRAPATSCGEIGSEHRPISVVMRLARVLWPVKTASELAMRTRVTQRQAEYWLAGKYDLSADALAGLLRSEEGLKILSEIIGPNAKPTWWNHFNRQVRRGEIRQRQIELAKEIERLEALEDAESM